MREFTLVILQSSISLSKRNMYLQHSNTSASVTVTAPGSHQRFYC